MAEHALRGHLAPGARPEVRGHCECQDASHLIVLAEDAGHVFLAPFVAAGRRFLLTTAVGAFPICAPCHELGHMTAVR